jgi:hypothetical protein
MSLFDMIKEKATELLGGAGEKVSELTGVDLPIGETADQVTESATEVTESGQAAVETATTQGQEIVDSTGPLGDTATGLAGDVVDPNARR